MITYATMQFWGSVVQDEQLEQLNTQLREVEAQLSVMRTSLRVMSLIIQATKAAELKELQHHIMKVQECHHHRITQLEEFQDVGEQLSLKSVNTL